MNQGELEVIRDAGNEPCLQGMSLSTLLNNVVIDGKVAIPVYAVDSSLPDNIDLEIFDETGTFIAMLCFCRQLGEIDIGALTAWQSVAYWTAIARDQYQQRFVFDCDYVVIDERYFNTYTNRMKDSAALWGGFSHDIPTVPIKRQTSQIIAKQGIIFPTQFHKQQALHAVEASHPFDRFLKMYHQLELLFDWVIVKRIQGMGADLAGIAQVMSRYTSGDLPSLKTLLNEYLHSPDKIWSAMRAIDLHIVTATEMFQNFNKDGNPLKESANWKKICDALKAGDYQNAISGALLAKDKAVANKIIYDTSAYWLFRSRCSIAHNRIGEFILTDADATFVLQFSEPLLYEVVAQVLSNPSLPK